jgi:hypothetical protein
MLITPIYKGSGLGNQLANYVTCRSLALDKGYKFGIAYPENFKGFFFEKIDFGEPVKGLVVPVEGGEPSQLPEGMKYYRETSSDYDQFVMNIPDNYVIHGNLQGERYFEKNKDLIREWLKVEELEMPDDLCVINFRGGEYVGVPDFFLPKSYWDNAIFNMRQINPDMMFEVHTDDVETARQFFPEFSCYHDIEINWRSIRYAKYIILSNSSFGWFSSWLNQDMKKIIAPKWFQRHNREYWHLIQNLTKCFTYQDKLGILHDYDSCINDITKND